METRFEIELCDKDVKCQSCRSDRAYILSSDKTNYHRSYLWLCKSCIEKIYAEMLKTLE